MVKAAKCTWGQKISHHCCLISEKQQQQPKQEYKQAHKHQRQQKTTTDNIQPPRYIIQSTNIRLQQHTTYNRNIAKMLTKILVLSLTAFPTMVQKPFSIGQQRACPRFLQTPAISFLCVYVWKEQNSQTTSSGKEVGQCPGRWRLHGPESCYNSVNAARQRGQSLVLLQQRATPSDVGLDVPWHQKLSALQAEQVPVVFNNDLQLYTCAAILELFFLNKLNKQPYSPYKSNRNYVAPTP